MNRSKWIDGQLVSAQELGVTMTLPPHTLPPFRGFRLTPSTGKAESQWLYPVLSMLATSTPVGLQTWMGVPWRMVRGVYLNQGFFSRLFRSHDRVLGELGEEGCVTYVMNLGGRPSSFIRLWIQFTNRRAHEAELINGVRHLVEYGYIKLVEHKGETYIVPLDKFYECGGISRFAAA